ncbi:MAG: DUF2683 family protein [Ginsengibacter sp.]
MQAITIHPKNEEQLNALEIILKAMKVPFEKSKTDKNPYDPEFVAKIKRSEKNFEEGKYTAIKIEDLWK